MSALLRTKEIESSTTSILHLSIASSQSKGNIGKNTMCSKWVKGCRLYYKKNEATIDYSFLTLQVLLLQCIQEAQYIALQIGNEGSSPSVLKAYGRPRVKLFGTL